MAEYDYMAGVCDFMQEAAGLNCIDKSINLIRQKKDIIFEIAENVEELGFFQDSQKKYEEFLNDVRKSPKQVWLKEAWCHFLMKCAEAPTSLHLRSVVILVIPAIAQFLREEEMEVAS